MNNINGLKITGNKIATFKNHRSTEQEIDVLYLRERNAFVTFGIKRFFGEKEILIPAYLVVSDFQLIGAIISTILEKLSVLCNGDGQFNYASRLEAMGQEFSLIEEDDYMILDRI